MLKKPLKIKALSVPSAACSCPDCPGESKRVATGAEQVPGGILPKAQALPHRLFSPLHGFLGWFAAEPPTSGPVQCTGDMGTCTQRWGRNRDCVLGESSKCRVCQCQPAAPASSHCGWFVVASGAPSEGQSSRQQY